MDLNDLLAYNQKSSTSTIYETIFEFNESTQEHCVVPSKDQSNTLSVQQALSPSEDTIKSYLIDNDGSPSSSSNPSCRPDGDGSTLPQSMSNEFYAQGIFTDLFDSNVQQVNFDLPTTSNSLSDAFLSLPTLSYYSNEHQTCQRQNSEQYAHRKANFMYLLQRGYKLIIKLNNSETLESWNRAVAQKLLSVRFTPLSLKTEYLSTQLALDQFETLVLDEATEAFKVKRSFKLGSSLIDKIANPTSAHLVSICNKIKGFRKLVNCDKISLLISGFYEMNLLKGISGYNQSSDGWQILETFPGRWKNDQKAMALISLIIIFNFETRGLKHVEQIRKEQYNYIYLLERYLKSRSQSTCEASNDHYRIMVKIQQLITILRLQFEQEAQSL